MQQASLARLLTTYDDSSVAAAQAAAATDVSSALAIVDYGEDEDDDGDGDGYDESGTDEAAPPANAAEVEGEDAPASAVQHHLRCSAVPVCAGGGARNLIVLGAGCRPTRGCRSCRLHRRRRRRCRSCRRSPPRMPTSAWWQNWRSTGR
eukprot:TRINITY_DN507_c0_g1_i3.p2 TRINITY_DN507_c0_g1~~TRINITY_DN507_c0_g1_i3.p2  ORF type:complete len:159 (+),score=23.07 TRINITY_DN507_c0_g1_i3:31-477(+)